MGLPQFLVGAQIRLPHLRIGLRLVRRAFGDLAAEVEHDPVRIELGSAGLQETPPLIQAVAGDARVDALDRRVEFKVVPC